jgi:metallophosphoesterase (TIGR00282 family)
MSKSLTVLFIGDIVGAYGRAITKLLLPELKKEVQPDLILANAENAAHGYSLTEKIYREFLEMGIAALTMGNHVWEKKELVAKIDELDKLVRPANYPPGVPGREVIYLDCAGQKVAVINLLGRVFMQCLDCPFQAADRLLDKVREKTKLIIVDFHAEATSEKTALGYYLDGRVSAVLGTHTHVITADERVLTQGTAFISDVGMVAAQESIIGMNREQILKRFLTQMPEKFEPTEYGPGIFNAVALKLDCTTGQALEIKRIIKTTEALKLPKVSQSLGN